MTERDTRDGSMKLWYLADQYVTEVAKKWRISEDHRQEGPQEHSNRENVPSAVAPAAG